MVSLGLSGRDSFQSRFIFEDMANIMWTNRAHTLLFCGGCLLLLLVVGCQNDDLKVSQSAAATTAPEDAENLPKAVIDEPQHDFGAMEVGRRDSHEFVIRNEGKGVLKLKKERSTCKCTMADFEEAEVAPGESTVIRLEWEAKVLEQTFSQAAYISTNDPDMDEIELRVVGRIDQDFDITPSGSWALGELSGDQPVEFNGRITSNVIKQLEFISHECDNPLVQIELTKMDDEKLQELGAKQGYEITGKLEPGVPIGPLSEKVMMKFRADGEEKFAIFGLEGYRSGPMQIVGPFGWSAAEMMMVLGRFPAANGKKVALSIFLRDNPGPALEIVELKCNPDFVKVDLVRDEKFQAENRERYVLTIEVPPGAPSVAHEKNDMGKIHIKTNNPKVEEIKINLNMISY